MTTLIKNGKVVFPSGVKTASILIKDGKIAQIGDISAAADEVIDAEGSFVCPGFIDMHTHGAGGSDFMDGTVEAYLIASKMQARHGATLVYPTTLTSSNEELFDSFETYRKAVEANTEGARFGGMHLEGPYFNPAQAGAQDPRYLRCPNDPKEYEEIMQKADGILKRWSFAPELEGAPQFAAAIRKRGILASIGHTNATFDECEAAYESGASHMTHFFSCMSSIRRERGIRIPGVIEFGLFQKGMSIEIIADGIHVPKNLLRLVLSVKGVDKIALVTDSMRGAGMPDGPSILGSLKDGQACMIGEGVAWMPDYTCFAGSVCTCDRLVRTMMNIAGCSVTDAVRMMTENPARMMGIYDRKGSIAPGKDADLVIWNGDVHIQRTIINGNTVYNAD
ncbi:MAG: N-acetylglucosamine-6-phosphate deacetylase [Candidatus Cryptobacteroides sp.]|nr:N-acetylglucosamine-6-phosphate deacetylase [Candidatus Cryptobacteroides sp.]